MCELLAVKLRDEFSDFSSSCDFDPAVSQIAVCIKRGYMPGCRIGYLVRLPGNVDVKSIILNRDCVVGRAQYVNADCISAYAEYL